MLDGDKLTDRAAVDQLLELHEERGIAQDMADGQHAPGLPRLFAHCDQLRAVIAHRLFAQHVISLFQRLHDRLEVHSVLCADEYTVCKLFLSERLFPACKAAAFGNAVLLGKCGAAVCARLRHADDLQLVREAQRVGGIDVRAALTRAQNDRGNWFHRQASLYSISSTVSAGSGSR